MSGSSRWLPFAVRAELLRLRRRLVDVRELARLSRRKDEPGSYEFVLARAESPLERTPGAVQRRLQEGKERNVSIAAERIDRTVIRPGEIFSYHRSVGRPSRLRGFIDGLELRNGEKAQGPGGGCCQVSNMLYWLAINAGLGITERHRHGLDLFPDHQRSVPFGCGATVFYNYLDLRFENCLSDPVMLRLGIQDRRLIGTITTRRDPGFRVRIQERDHRFFEELDGRFRENRVYRIIEDTEGVRLREDLLAHNRGRVMY